MTALRPDVVADLRQENARLQAELRAGVDRQAASAEILRAIASTSGDAERSLQQIAEITARLFDAPSVTVHVAKGDEWGQTIRVGTSSKRIGMEVPAGPPQIQARNLPSPGRRSRVPRAPARWPPPRCGPKGRRSAFSSFSATGSLPSQPKS